MVEGGIETITCREGGFASVEEYLLVEEGDAGAILNAESP
jgi:hypothetical protein